MLKSFSCILLLIHYVTGQCLQHDAPPPKCIEWVDVEHKIPVFFPHQYNCSKFWVCQPDLTDCLHECAAADQDGGVLYFDFTIDYEHGGPVCNWPWAVDCENKPSVCVECQPWQECVECGDCTDCEGCDDGWMCTPDCKLDVHCNGDEYCDYNEGGNGNCQKGCRNNEQCSDCGICENHVCNNPECCSDDDCDGVCEDGVCTDCRSDSDCVAMPCSTCLNSQCVDPECCIDDDCLDSQFCNDDNQCQVGCNEDSDCNSIMNCAICQVDNTCTDPECCSDNDCLDSQFCNDNNQCQDGCNENSDCNSIMTCAICLSNNTCTTPECCGDNHCNSVMTCAVCLDDNSCSNPECCSDNDCLDSEFCNDDNQCQEGCNEDSDCNSSMECAVCLSDHTCTDPECCTDDDCQAGQSCDGFNNCGTSGANVLTTISFTTESCAGCSGQEPEGGPIFHLKGEVAAPSAKECDTAVLDHPDELDFLPDNQSIFGNEKDKNLLSGCYRVNLQGKVVEASVTWTGSGEWIVKDNQVNFAMYDDHTCISSCCVPRPLLSGKTYNLPCQLNCAASSVCN